MCKNAGEILEELSALYLQRNKVYGNNYKQFGYVLSAIFPNGICLKSPEDFNRMGLFFHMMDKATRYAQNFEKGGHSDSLHDSSVYAAMLSELDQQLDNKEKKKKR